MKALAISPERPGSDLHRARTIAALIGAAAWLVYLATAGGTLATTDAVAMFAQAEAIVSRGEMDVSRKNSSKAWRGVDGRYYLPFGVAQPIYDIPFLLAGRAVSKVLGRSIGDADALPKAAVALGSTLPAAVSVALAFLLAWRLSSDLRASLVAAAALAFGTLLWPYAKFGANAALATAALTGAVYGIGIGGLTARRGALAAGGGALGVAWLTRHEMAVVAVAALVWLGWQTRRHASRAPLMLVAMAGVIVAAVIWMMLNAVHFGDPLWSGYRPPISFGGAAAFLVSPSGALVLFSPVAIAAVALLPRLKSGDPLAWLTASVALALVAVYGSLQDWLGTRSYGPRYLVPLLPLLVAPLALWWKRARRVRRRFLLAALIAVSVLVQIPGILVDFYKAGIAFGEPPQAVRRDEWQWCPIWINVRFAAEAVPANLRYVTGRSPIPLRLADAQSLSDRLSFSLDFWWLYLLYLGVLPRWAAMAAAILPLAGAAGLGLAAYRKSRAAS
jgi:hypothetical protein